MFQTHQPLVEKSVSVSLASTGDKATFSFPHNAKILSIGLLVEGTDASTCTVAFDKRPLAGSDTGRGTADIGSVVKAASNKQGKLLREDLVQSAIEVNAGDQIVAEVTVATGGACTAVVVIEFARLDESDVNLADVELL